MKKFDRLTLSQKVSEDIAGKIIIGELKPGERLLEDELTEIYGTSRSPIREAFYLLEIQGVVQRIPRKGVFVKRHTKKEIHDLYNAVYGIMGITVEQGIETCTQKQLESMYEVLNKMETFVKIRDFKEYLKLVGELLFKLFELPGNTTFIDLYSRLDTHWRTFRYLALSHPKSIEKSVKEYSEIVSAIEEKDLSKVKRILYTKKTRGLATLEKVIENKEENLE